MTTCIRIFGKERDTPKSEWREVVCHVSYGDHKSHRQIVEDSFEYHLGTDVGYLKKHHPDHFSAPHNVGRAILLYYYFRNRFLIFNDDRYQYIATGDLPDRPADSQDDTYSLWIELVPPSN
jgi:hypothetical protein